VSELRGRWGTFEILTKITTSERNSSLCSSTVVRFLAWHAAVDSLDDGLEGSKFHHSVRNLSTPERVKALVESEVCQLCDGALNTLVACSPCSTLLARDYTKPIERSRSKGRDTGLHTDFHSFEGA